jgi:predicted small lipoprotein YifL
MKTGPRHRLRRAAAFAAACLVSGLLAACGQTGKLYLPQPEGESQGEIVTRPTQTPPPETGTDSGKSSNSPQTVDTPRSPDTPAITRPEGEGSDGKKDKKDGVQNPPAASPPQN